MDRVMLRWCEREEHAEGQREGQREAPDWPWLPLKENILSILYHCVLRDASGALVKGPAAPCMMSQRAQMPH